MWVDRGGVGDLQGIFSVHLCLVLLGGDGYSPVVNFFSIRTLTFPYLSLELSVLLYLLHLLYLFYLLYLLYYTLVKQ